MAPPALHTSQALVPEEVWNGLQKKIAWRKKICVEDGQEFPSCVGKPGFECTRLKSAAIGTVKVYSLDPLNPKTFNGAPSKCSRLVRRIVQHLDLEPVARVIQTTGACNQALDDGTFVVDRKLYGDRRQERASAFLARTIVNLRSRATAQLSGGCERDRSGRSC